RQRAQVDIADRALGAAIHDSNDDRPVRTGQLDISAANRGVGVIGLVHRANHQVLWGWVERTVSASVGLLVVGCLASTDSSNAVRGAPHLQHERYEDSANGGCQPLSIQAAGADDQHHYQAEW